MFPNAGMAELYNRYKDKDKEIERGVERERVRVRGGGGERERKKEKDKRRECNMFPIAGMVELFNRYMEDKKDK